MGGTSDARNKRKYSYHCRQMNLFFVPVDAFKLNCQPFFIPGLYLVLNVLSNTLYPRMNRTDSNLDRKRYDEYDGRHRLKVRKDDELTSARVRPTFTSYPSSTATSSRDSAMSSSRDSATSASRRRNQEITQV